MQNNLLKSYRLPLRDRRSLSTTLGIEMRKYIFTLLCCLVAVPAFATRQVQDKLHHQDCIYEIGGHTDFPLEKYFRSLPEEERRQKHKILSSTTNGVVRCVSTGCWRGYIATWAVETNMLYLTKLEVQGLEVAVSELKYFFGDRIKDEKLKAFWFSGPIRIDDKILVFEEGKLTKTHSPDRMAISKVYKELKKKYSEQNKENSQPIGAR